MSSLLHDVRYSLRSLRRSPSFALLFVAILALAVGASAALFSVVDHVVLRPLGFDHEERLVVVATTNPERGVERGGQFVPDYWALREQSRELEELSFFGWRSLTLEVPGQVQQLRSVAVSGGLFELLGSEPKLGRVLQETDEVPGWGQVAVISEGLWRRVFAADPTIVGRALPLNGRSVTVVGVMSDDVELLPVSQPEIWLPVGRFEGYEHSAFGREERDFVVVGRLAEGSTPGHAESEVRRIAGELAQQNPATNDGWTMTVLPLRDWVVGETGRALGVSFGAVILLFAIGLVNLAALSTVRLLGRRDELAVRRALGAGARDVLRQLLVESALLTLLGSTLAFAITWVLEQALSDLAPGVLPRNRGLGFDARTALFALSMCLLTALVVAFVGFVLSSGSELLTRRGRSGGVTRGGERLRRLLVAAEVTLALTLLIAASLLVETVDGLSRVDPGFSVADTYSAHILLDGKRYGPWPLRQEYFRTVTERVRQIPGVEAAALATMPPVPGLGVRIDSSYRGAEGPAADEPRAPRASFRIAGPGLLDTLGIPLLGGRDLSERDDLDHPRVALVNRALAERAWPGDSAIGKRLEIFYEEVLEVEVVGVVGDTHADGLHLPARPAFYLAYEQLPFMGTAIVLRSRLPPLQIEESVRRAVLSVDPAQPLMRFDALASELESSLARERFFASLLSLFALVALVLASAGVYGVFAHWALRRRREFGLRLALGSTRADLVLWVLRLAALGVIPGLIAGVLGGNLLSHALASAFASVAGPSVGLVLAGTALLGLTALGASILPAISSSRVSPAIVLGGND